MLSYQHAYHAGGPADVHKHVALTALVDHLRQKEKPYCAIDVFAGEAVYDLAGPAAAKTHTFARGIGALLTYRPNAPAAVAHYLAQVRALNPTDALLWYPGSPALLKMALRTHDRLMVNELHPAAAAALRRWSGNDRRIAVHKRDGLEALIALVPPTIRRGLVIIDPSYEDSSDYRDVAAALVTALRKWSTGLFLLWYPLLTAGRHHELLDVLGEGTDLPIMISELGFDLEGLSDAPALGLRGSGLAVINPPWHCDEQLAESGRWLTAALEIGAGASHTLRWLHRPR